MDSPAQSPPLAIVLFGHGSRDPRWKEPFEATRTEVERQMPAACVRLAFLEHTPPDLDAAVAALAADGHRAIEVVPLFLGAGAHVRNDIPAQAAAAAERHSVSVRVQPFVGESPAVIAAIARHVGATLAEAGRGG
jgi:sirohydrochlorin cobaltochelatase